MYEQEVLGRELLALLERHLGGQARPVHLRLEGAGVHWHVQAGHPERGGRVHLFHYPREGAEYYCELSQGGHVVARGRTRSREDVPGLLKAWLVRRVPLEAIFELCPFIDRQRRELTTLGQRLDAALASQGSPTQTRLIKTSGDSYELWVYGEDRSCQLKWRQEGQQARCTFRRLYTDMAVGETTDTDALAAAIAQWMDGRVRTGELRREFPFVRVEPHARAYEVGRLAEWRWDEALERARSPQAVERRDELVYHLPLLERLAPQPAVRRFFTFTSHQNLCFSRCPDYPFSTRGLPYVTPLLERGQKPGHPVLRYRATAGKRRLEGDAESICRFIEEVLQAEGDSTFDGTLDDAMREAVNRMLVTSGSALRCTRTYAGQEARMVVTHQGRACHLSAEESSSSEAHPMSYCVGFLVSQPQKERVAEGNFSDLDTLGRALRLWLEEQAPLPLLQEQFPVTKPE